MTLEDKVLIELETRKITALEKMAFELNEIKNLIRNNYDNIRDMADGLVEINDNLTDISVATYKIEGTLRGIENIEMQRVS